MTTGRRDADYPGWIRVTTADGNEGWAPEQLLNVNGPGTALALDAYTARELDTTAGEVVDCLRELSGWIWVRNSEGAEGWVPAATLGDP